jgi:hypothetical protein
MYVDPLIPISATGIVDLATSNSICIATLNNSKQIKVFAT